MKYDWLDEYLLSLPGAEKDYKPEWAWFRYRIRYLLGNVEESTAIGILSDLSKLNADGKREAGKRVNELTEIKKYTE